MYRIELDAPNLGTLEKEYLNRAVDSGFISTVGPFVVEFEERFSKYLGVPRTVSVQNGTAAIHLSLCELGIGPGDEVIVPALSFIATVNPLRYVGATPVFADVDLKTWNMLPGEVENLITERTKAILPVHLYGNPCDMDSLMAVAGKHGLPVIEDATESLGATYGNRFTGTFGDFGCFSFNGNKIITTGGGGILVGKDPVRLAHIKSLANQAKDEGREGYHREIGFNYRMTNIEAALGLAQLERLESFLVAKRDIQRIYREELASVEAVSFQTEYVGSQSSCWFTCLFFETDVDIPSFQARLAEKNVPSRRVFVPLPDQPPYRDGWTGSCRNAREIYRRGLCLPGSTLNSAESTRFVCATLKQLLAVG
jgi:perosamine synthetase